MMNIEEIKNDLVTILRNNMYPNCTVQSTFSPLTNGTIATDIAQSFVPWSTTIQTIDVVLGKVGSPTLGVEVAIQTDNNNEPSGVDLKARTIPPSSIGATSTVTVNMYKGDLDSNQKYWIVLHQLESPGTVSYYNVYRPTADTFYPLGTALRNTGSWSSLDTDIYFKVIPRNWIFPDYPRSDLSKSSYPRVAVEVRDRPRIVQKWLDWRVAEYRLSVNFIVYSRFIDELEDIISYIDRYIFKNRVNVSSFIKYIIPSRMSPVTPARTRQTELLVRSIGYEIVGKMSV